MDFVKKVYAESDPADEKVEESDKGQYNGNFEENDIQQEVEVIPFREGPPPDPDDDCTCICFCEKGDDESAPVEEEEEEELVSEIVDPQDELKEKCSDKKDCVAYKEKLDECTARVEGRSKTSETCVEELIDFMHCVDHCVSKTLFTKLK